MSPMQLRTTFLRISSCRPLYSSFNGVPRYLYAQASGHPEGNMSPVSHECETTDVSGLAGGEVSVFAGFPLAENHIYIPDPDIPGCRIWRTVPSGQVDRYAWPSGPSIGAGRRADRSARRPRGGAAVRSPGRVDRRHYLCGRHCQCGTASAGPLPTLRYPRVRVTD